MTNLDSFFASEQTRQVLVDVAQERRRQINKGWTPEHDDAHSSLGFERLVLVRLLAASKTMSYSGTRRCLVQAAAVVVAAIESIDRKMGSGT